MVKNGIALKNEKKLKAMLEDVQRRSRVRCIEYGDIVGKLERVISYLGVSKKSLVGTEIRCDVCAQKFPRAYKYTPESTIFEAVYTVTGWRVMDIYRGECSPTGTKIYLSDTAKEALIDKAEKADWL